MEYSTEYTDRYGSPFKTSKPVARTEQCTTEYGKWYRTNPVADHEGSKQPLRARVRRASASAHVSPRSMADTDPALWKDARAAKDFVASQIADPEGWREVGPHSASVERHVVHHPECRGWCRRVRESVGSWDLAVGSIGARARNLSCVVSKKLKRKGKDIDKE